MQPTSLGEIIKFIRVPVVAEACERTPRAIYKWIKSGCLPRTEYTGETTYASKIAEVSGGRFTSTQILEISKPKAA